MTASFSSPILVKSDAFGSMTGRGSHHSEPTEQIVAGGVEFAMPVSWGRLGATAASGDAAEAGGVGTVVSALCPAGSKGATCAEGAQVTFVAYSGDDGHELPELDEFEHDLDRKLAKEFPGFAKGEVEQRPAADGMRWLDYAFAWRSGGRQVHQRFAAYRHHDGSGVVAMVTGSGSAKHEETIEAFLESGHGVGAEGH